MNEELKKLIILEPKKAVKNKYIGSIYVFRNQENNKLYIGKTIEDYNLRWNEHYYNAYTKQLKNYFYNAIRKYSWDKFDRFVIYQTEELEDKSIVDKIICEKEIFYINLFRSDSPEFGYNLTSGGEGVSGYKFSEESRKKMSEARKGEKHWNYGNYNENNANIILQFDLDFNFIQEWPSMSEINRQLGYKTSNLSKCCSNKLDTYKGFIWVRKSDYYDGYLQKFKTRAKCKSNDKAVLQYDVCGHFIAEYISCSAAGKALKKKDVSTAANGRDPQMYGYIWIYKDDFTEALLAEKLEKVKTCRFYNKYLEAAQTYEG